MKKWTRKTLAAEAKKYPSRAVFAKENASAYVTACRTGFLDEICAHMPPPKTYRKTTAQAIKEMIAVHGTKYDYSRVKYKNAHAKVEILCAEHGTFEQSPHSHLRGEGCPSCGFAATGQERRLTFDEFLARSRGAHGDRYDYSSVKYAGKEVKVEIGCSVHGAFFQYPLDHAKGFGCQKCGGLLQWETKRKWTEAAVIAESLKYATPTAFQKGNPSAWGAARKLGLIEQCYTHMTLQRREPWTRDEIEALAASYSSRTPFIKENQSAYEAAKRLGIWDEIAKHMDYGNTGFRKDKAATLYYIRVETADIALWKIGITNNTVESRFPPADLKMITVLHEERFLNGRRAYEKEQFILKAFKDDVYIGEPVLSSGNTELFIRDILDLDVEQAA